MKTPEIRTLGRTLFWLLVANACMRMCTVSIPAWCKNELACRHYSENGTAGLCMAGQGRGSGRQGGGGLGGGVGTGKIESASDTTSKMKNAGLCGPYSVTPHVGASSSGRLDKNAAKNLRLP